MKKMRSTVHRLQRQPHQFICYEEWNANAPERVVFLHGGGQTRWAWGGTALELAKRGFCVWAVDQRGHGESSWMGRGSYSLDHFVGDLEALVLQDRRPVHFVGASLGGYISLLLCAEHMRSWFRSLMLVDISVTVQPKGVHRILSFMQAYPDGFESIEAAADAVSVYLSHRKRPSSIEGLRRNLRLDNGRWYWHWDPDWLEPWDADVGIAKVQSRFEAAAKQLTIPTLLIRGLESDVVSEADVDYLQKLVPHAKACVIGSARHMVAGDSNHVFGEAVSSFLSELQESI